MKGYRITRDKFLDPDEVRRLMTTCEDKSLADVAKGRKTWVTRFMVVHLALHSGLRVSEIAALRIGDLHLNGRSPYLIVQRGKGGKKRDVYIDRGLVKHIREYLAIRADAWGESVEAEGLLFATLSGKSYTTAALHQSFKKALAEAGMKGRCSIHGARHSFGTILLAKTGNIRFVQKQLGHASLNMTALYADILPEQNSALANAILDEGTSHERFSARQPGRPLRLLRSHQRAADRGPTAGRPLRDDVPGLCPRHLSTHGDAVLLRSRDWFYYGEQDSFPFNTGKTFRTEVFAPFLVNFGFSRWK